MIIWNPAWLTAEGLDWNKFAIDDILQKAISNRTSLDPNYHNANLLWDKDANTRNDRVNTWLLSITTPRFIDVLHRKPSWNRISESPGLRFIE